MNERRSTEDDDLTPIWEGVKEPDPDEAGASTIHIGIPALWIEDHLMPAMNVDWPDESLAAG